MAVETLGQAWDAGWVGHMRCPKVFRTSEHLSHQCGFRHEIDMTTLVLAKGPRMELKALPARMKCPRCGTMPVTAVFSPPALPASGAQRAWEPPTPDAPKRAKSFGGRFTVDIIDRRTGNYIEQVATAERFEIAIPAWEAACQAMPSKWIILRQWGLRILRDSDEKALEQWQQTGT